MIILQMIRFLTISRIFIKFSSTSRLCSIAGSKRMTVICLFHFCMKVTFLANFLWIQSLLEIVLFHFESAEYTGWNIPLSLNVLLILQIHFLCTFRGRIKAFLLPIHASTCSMVYKGFYFFFTMMLSPFRLIVALRYIIVVTINLCSVRSFL